ncbi:TPA: hypothetical protein HA270_04770, partial [Candidatus Woesearchaeota archaeon]|nr:hypothetical protein [Candidatus Woesearchaeota archaeon]
QVPSVIIGPPTDNGEIGEWTEGMPAPLNQEGMQAIEDLLFLRAEAFEPYEEMQQDSFLQVVSEGKSWRHFMSYYGLERDDYPNKDPFRMFYALNMIDYEMEPEEISFSPGTAINIPDLVQEYQLEQGFSYINQLPPEQRLDAISSAYYDIMSFTQNTIYPEDQCAGIYLLEQYYRLSENPEAQLEPISSYTCYFDLKEQAAMLARLDDSFRRAIAAGEYPLQRNEALPILENAEWFSMCADYVLDIEDAERPTLHSVDLADISSYEGDLPPEQIRRLQAHILKAAQCTENAVSSKASEMYGEKTAIILPDKKPDGSSNIEKVLEFTPAAIWMHDGSFCPDSESQPGSKCKGAALLVYHVEEGDERVYDIDNVLRFLGNYKPDVIYYPAEEDFLVTAISYELSNNGYDRARLNPSSENYPFRILPNPEDFWADADVMHIASFRAEGFDNAIRLSHYAALRNAPLRLVDFDVQIGSVMGEIEASTQTGISVNFRPKARIVSPMPEHDPYATDYGMQYSVVWEHYIQGSVQGEWPEHLQNLDDNLVPSNELMADYMAISGNNLLVTADDTGNTEHCEHAELDFFRSDPHNPQSHAAGKMKGHFNEAFCHQSFLAPYYAMLNDMSILPVAPEWSPVRRALSEEIAVSAIDYYGGSFFILDSENHMIISYAPNGITSTGAADYSMFEELYSVHDIAVDQNGMHLITLAYDYNEEAYENTIFTLNTLDISEGAIHTVDKSYSFPTEGRSKLKKGSNGALVVNTKDELVFLRPSINGGIVSYAEYKARLAFRRSAIEKAYEEKQINGENLKALAKDTLAAINQILAENEEKLAEINRNRVSQAQAVLEKRRAAGYFDYTGQAGPFWYLPYGDKIKRAVDFVSNPSVEASMSIIKSGASMLLPYAAIQNELIFGEAKYTLSDIIDLFAQNSELLKSAFQGTDKYLPTFENIDRMSEVEYYSDGKHAYVMLGYDLDTANAISKDIEASIVDMDYVIDLKTMSGTAMPIAEYLASRIYSDEESLKFIMNTLYYHFFPALLSNQKLILKYAISENGYELTGTELLWLPSIIYDSLDVLSDTAPELMSLAEESRESLRLFNLEEIYSDSYDSWAGRFYSIMNYKWETEGMASLFQSFRDLKMGFEGDSESGKEWEITLKGRQFESIKKVAFRLFVDEEDQDAFFKNQLIMGMLSKKYNGDAPFFTAETYQELDEECSISSAGTFRRIRGSLQEQINLLEAAREGFSLEDAEQKTIFSGPNIIPQFSSALECKEDVDSTDAYTAEALLFGWSYAGEVFAPVERSYGYTSSDLSSAIMFAAFLSPKENPVYSVWNFETDSDEAENQQFDAKNMLDIPPADEAYFEAQAIGEGSRAISLGVPRIAAIRMAEPSPLSRDAYRNAYYTQQEGIFINTAESDDSANGLEYSLAFNQLPYSSYFVYPHSMNTYYAEDAPEKLIFPTLLRRGAIGVLSINGQKKAGSDNPYKKFFEYGYLGQFFEWTFKGITQGMGLYESVTRAERSISTILSMRLGSLAHGNLYSFVLQVAEIAAHRLSFQDSIMLYGVHDHKSRSDSPDAMASTIALGAAYVSGFSGDVFEHEQLNLHLLFRYNDAPDSNTAYPYPPYLRLSSDGEPAFLRETDLEVSWEVISPDGISGEELPVIEEHSGGPGGNSAVVLFKKRGNYRLIVKASSAQGNFDRRYAIDADINVYERPGRVQVTTEPALAEPALISNNKAFIPHDGFSCGNEGHGAIFADFEPILCKTDIADNNLPFRIMHVSGESEKEIIAAEKDCSEDSGFCFYRIPNQLLKRGESYYCSVGDEKSEVFTISDYNYLLVSHAYEEHSMRKLKEQGCLFYSLLPERAKSSSRLIALERDSCIQKALSYVDVRSQGANNLIAISMRDIRNCIKRYIDYDDANDRLIVGFHNMYENYKKSQASSREEIQRFDIEYYPLSGYYYGIPEVIFCDYNTLSCASKGIGLSYRLCSEAAPHSRHPYENQELHGVRVFSYEDQNSIIASPGEQGCLNAFPGCNANGRDYLRCWDAPSSSGRDSTGSLGNGFNELKYYAGYPVDSLGMLSDQGMDSVGAWPFTYRSVMGAPNPHIKSPDTAREYYRYPETAPYPLYDKSETPEASCIEGTDAVPGHLEKNLHATAGNENHRISIDFSCRGSGRSWSEEFSNSFIPGTAWDASATISRQDGFWSGNAQDAAAIDAVFAECGNDPVQVSLRLIPGARQEFEYEQWTFCRIPDREYTTCNDPTARLACGQETGRICDKAMLLIPASTEGYNEEEEDRVVDLQRELHQPNLNFCYERAEYEELRQAYEHEEERKEYITCSEGSGDIFENPYGAYAACMESSSLSSQITHFHLAAGERESDAALGPLAASSLFRILGLELIDLNEIDLNRGIVEDALKLGTGLSSEDIRKLVDWLFFRRTATREYWRAFVTNFFGREESRKILPAVIRDVNDFYFKLTQENIAFVEELRESFASDIRRGGTGNSEEALAIQDYFIQIRDMVGEGNSLTLRNVKIVVDSREGAEHALGIEAKQGFTEEIVFSHEPASRQSISIENSAIEYKTQDLSVTGDIMSTIAYLSGGEFDVSLNSPEIIMKVKIKGAEEKAEIRVVAEEARFHGNLLTLEGIGISMNGIEGEIHNEEIGESIRNLHAMIAADSVRSDGVFNLNEAGSTFSAEGLHIESGYDTINAQGAFHLDAEIRAGDINADFSARKITAGNEAYYSFTRTNMASGSYASVSAIADSIEAGFEGGTTISIAGLTNHYSDSETGDSMSLITSKASYTVSGEGGEEPFVSIALEDIRSEISCNGQDYRNCVFVRIASFALDESNGESGSINAAHIRYPTAPEAFTVDFTPHISIDSITSKNLLHYEGEGGITFRNIAVIDFPFSEGVRASASIDLMDIQLQVSESSESSGDEEIEVADDIYATVGNIRNGEVIIQTDAGGAIEVRLSLLGDKDGPAIRIMRQFFENYGEATFRNARLSLSGSGSPANIDASVQQMTFAISPKDTLLYDSSQQFECDVHPLLPKLHPMLEENRYRSCCSSEQHTTLLTSAASVGSGSSSFERFSMKEIELPLFKKQYAASIAKHDQQCVHAIYTCYEPIGFMPQASVQQFWADTHFGSAFLWRLLFTFGRITDAVPEIANNDYVLARVIDYAAVIDDPYDPEEMKKARCDMIRNCIDVQNFREESLSIQNIISDTLLSDNAEINAGDTGHGNRILGAFLNAAQRRILESRTKRSLVPREFDAERTYHAEGCIEGRK